MKQYLIDTNALLSYVSDRNINQQERINIYFEEAALLKHELIIIENVITEFVYVLKHIYNINNNSIKDILLSLIDTPGIVIMSEFNLNEILKLWPKFIKDYGDALIAACARSKKIPIVTFDKQFIKELSKLKITFIDI